MAKEIEFYQGRPCKYGHPGKRYASTGMCVECQSRENREQYLSDPEGQRRRSTEWRERNRDREHERYRRWAAANKEKRALTKRVGARNRYARSRRAGGNHTAADVAEIEKSQRRRCAYCKRRLIRKHVDHIMPLARGGSNDKRNLQVLCPPCNNRKQAQDPIVFARKIGLLI